MLQAPTLKGGGLAIFHILSEKTLGYHEFAGSHTAKIDRIKLAVQPKLSAE